MAGWEEVLVMAVGTCLLTGWADQGPGGCEGLGRGGRQACHGRGWLGRPMGGWSPH